MASSTSGKIFGGGGRPTLILLAVLLLSACTDGPDHRATLTEALEIARQNALKRGELDWAVIEKDLAMRSNHLRDEASFYEALQGLLDQLGDNHSFLRTADGCRWRATASQPEMPPAPAIRPEPGIAYIEINPMASGAGEDMAVFADALYAKILAAYRSDQIGWILDFRRNTGGQLWPMLAGLSPLIQSRPAGQAVYPDGVHWRWWARDGQAGVGDQIHHAVTEAQARNLPQLPIAILVGGATASSGEAGVISFLGQDHVRVFGSRTRGLATINQPFKLDCGAVLMLTTAFFADRRGRTWPHGIQPDEVIDDGGDAMQPAVEWLRKAAAAGLGR